MQSLALLAIISIVSASANENALLDKFLTGKVTHYGEKIIEKYSQLLAELRDLNATDPVEKMIGVINISDSQAFPISYRVKYNPSLVVSGHTYSLSIKINAPDGRLQYINDGPVRMEFNKSVTPVIDILVKPVDSNLNATQTSVGTSCPQVDCHRERPGCPFGYIQREGCLVCECHDPCYPSSGNVTCGPNERCFATRTMNGTYLGECKAAPSKPEGTAVSQEVCDFPEVSGPCRAYFPRYFYNSKRQACELFTYGGCQSNGNNFETKEDCETLCKI